MNYSRLKEIIKEKKFTIEKVSVSIGMTASGFYAAVKNDTMTIRTLENISKTLEVPLMSFFTEEKPQIENYPNNASLTTANELNPNTKVNMEKLINAQEEIIAMQKEKIETLENRLTNFEEDCQSKDVG